MAAPLFLVLDVGTTNIKVFVFNKKAEIVALARRKQEYLIILDNINKRFNKNI